MNKTKKIQQTMLERNRKVYQQMLRNKGCKGRSPKAEDEPPVVEVSNSTQWQRFESILNTNCINRKVKLEKVLGSMAG